MVAQTPVTVVDAGLCKCAAAAAAAEGLTGEVQFGPGGWERRLSVRRGQPRDKAIKHETCHENQAVLQSTVD